MTRYEPLSPMPKPGTPARREVQGWWRRRDRCRTCKGARWQTVALDQNGRYFLIGHSGKRKRINPRTVEGNLKPVDSDPGFYRRNYGYVQLFKCVDPIHERWNEPREDSDQTPDGWPAQTKERASAVAERAAATKTRNRRRQGKDNR